MNRFRIAELAKRTNTSKETIHYYLRIGLLKKPQKTSRNMAYYDESHVEQLSLIRKLRTENYLPLSVIKKMIRNGEILVAESRINLAEELLYQAPSSEQTKSKKSSVTHGNATSLNADQLKRYEEAGLLLPSTRSGESKYGWEDIRIAELLNAAESEMPKEAYDFIVERFKIMERHMSDLVQDEAAHFFSSLTTLHDPSIALSVLQGGRETVGKYLALSRVRRLRYEIDQLLGNIEGVLFASGPDVRPQSKQLPFSTEIKSESAKLQKAMSDSPGSPKKHIEVLNFLLNHGLDIEAASLCDNLNSKLRKDFRIQLLYAEALVEVRRHDEALDVLNQISDEEPAVTSGKYLFLSAALLRRLRDRLLLSAVDDAEQQREHLVSSSEIIEDLIHGLSYLNKYGEITQEKIEDLQSFRHHYFAARVHLALPPLLGKSQQGIKNLNDLLLLLPQFSEAFPRICFRFEWSISKALLLHEKNQNRVDELCDRVRVIEDMFRDESP
ncbi:MAG: MerR family transcriptional regulator [Myxococcota bacterium]|nr:MerR family transcriptional regulator [Myxococcota bacterium]